MLGITLGVYFGFVILLNIPYVQQKTSVFVADELSELLEAEVSIGRINVGLFNRIIIDDLLLNDQADKEMLKVARLSAKFNPFELLRGRISISSVQLFGFNITLNKANPDAEANCGFVIRAFTPKENNRKTTIDLRINSLLIRRGRLAYDVLSEAETPGKFNPKHVKLYNIIGNISLKALTNDSINAQIKRFSVDEQSGLELRKLSLKLLGNEHEMTVENFEVALPNTSLRMDTIRMQYDSLEAFSRFITDVQFSFKMLPSFITPQDISPFVPALANFKEKIDLDLDANGTVNQLNIPRLTLYAGNHMRIRGNVAFQDLADPENAFIFGNLSHFSLNKEGLDFLSRNFTENYEQTPRLLGNLGNVSFRGEVSGYFTDLVTYGVFRTELGTVNVDVKLHSDKPKGIFSYSGKVKTDEFELGRWLDFEKWGKISFNLDVNSTFYRDRKYPFVLMKGLVSSLEYSDYAYENITLDGEYKSGGFNGKVALDDPNGAVFLNGSFNLSEKIPTFNFLADVKHIRPHELNLTPDYKDSEFSLKVRADFVGGSIDEMIGTINIDSLSFSSTEETYFMDNLRVLATRDSGKNTLALRSGFMSADIEGNYSYRTLPHTVMNMLGRYAPAIFPARREVATDNNLSFDIQIYNSEILPKVFDIPLHIYSHSTFKGYINEKTNRLRLEGYFPRFQYGNAFVESGMVLLENPSDHLRGRIRLSNHRKKGTVNLALDATAQNDTLITRLNWGNSATSTYSGHFLAKTSFSRNEGKGSSLKTVVDIQPTQVILNDTIWKIHPSQIVADSGRIHIDNFYFGDADQYIKVNGYASQHEEDTVKVDLKEVSVGYVFEIVNLKSVDFNGLATGAAYASRVLKSPVMNTRLFVKDFSFNNGLFGDLNVYGEWNQQEQGIYVDGHVREKDIADIDVKGYIYPLRPKSGLDLSITPRNANMKFMEYYTKSIISDIKGRTTGHIRLYGPFSALNLQGDARADATFKVNTLNTYFTLADSVHFVPERMSVQRASISDAEGHFGTVTGHIQHRNFKDMAYRLELDADNMLVMNTVEDPEVPFYGKVYGTGNAQLSGNDEGIRVDAAVVTNRNTHFVYTLASAASAANTQFIKFVDKTPNINALDSIQLMSDFELARQNVEEDTPEMDVRLNIQVDVTPDATVRIVMDPASDDHIAARGNGNIRLEYYNKGDARMFGSYDITQGMYKFSLQEVIRKDFLIKEGGNIAFSGDPYESVMDIQAVYTVNSASLTDLVPEGILSDRNLNRNLRVNCLMNLTGSLFRPMVKLDIELPNVSSETENLVRNYIRTDEDINMQILYLLAIGKFYTPDYVTVNQNSNMMTSVLSSTLSGQLNRILSQIIDNNNWVIGTNLSTGERGWTDMEVEGMLSGQLLNNRLLINGNFGYRDNPLSNTNFVGDFEAEWLLTRAGDIRLKAYNETNDQYYTRSNLTTQGVGIIYRKDFDRWRDLFFPKRRRARLLPALPAVSVSDTLRRDSISPRKHHPLR